LFGGATLAANAGKMDYPPAAFAAESQEEVQDKTMTIDLLINHTISIRLENVPTSGYLEVYSILGVKVTGVNLKTISAPHPIELPKGIYILKAGKVAQKIIVR
jgi:hypothetical protein